MNQQIDDTERDLIFQRLKQIPENNVCFDCSKKHPKWSSVYLGLYLCLDCAGKHREYGPQISFARSLNLDTWNKRYITFMELGGNGPAMAYFTKHGLKAPFDYKNSTIQKYKADLTKKVEAILESSRAEEAPVRTVFASKPEDAKIHSEKVEMPNHALMTKSFSDKPTHGDKPEEDPFLALLNDKKITTKGFTVEFNKNKPAFGAGKGRLAAKKIDNIDLDKMTLNEDGTTSYMKNKYEMTDSAFGMSGGSAPVKEVFTKSSSPYTPEMATDEKLKKFSGAKAISSDSFKTEAPAFDAANARKFAGASAISSAQYFGEKEPDNDDSELYQTAENMRDIISTIGGKLKDKADGFMSKLKNEWGN